MERMMSSVHRSMHLQNHAGTVVVPTSAPSLFPAALPSAGAQFAFFPHPTAFGLPPPLIGSPTAPDFHLSAPYTRPLSGTLESCYPLLPYGMAISKGSPPDTTEGSVTKKPRTVFSPKQLLYLEEEFLKNQFPNMEHRKKIAKHLDLTQQHIQIWFQNRRAKKRRKNKRNQAEQQMKHTPKPPDFWPSNLPFSSNISDIVEKTMDNKTTETSTENLTVNTEESNSPANDNSHFHSAQNSPSPETECTSPETHNEPAKASPDSSTLARPSHLECGTSPAVYSPTLAVTPNNGHLQFQSPQISPSISALPTMESCSRAELSSLVESPPSVSYHPSVSLPTYNPSSQNYSSTANPIFSDASLSNFNLIQTQELSSAPCLSSYPFGMSSSFSNPLYVSESSQYLENSIYTLYAGDIKPSSVAMMVDSKSLSPAIALPLSVAQELSIMSQTTLHVDNSDCSLVTTSPLAMDVTLPPSTISDDGSSVPSVSSTSNPDILVGQDEGDSFMSGLVHLHESGSPIYAAEPVTLSDILGTDWDLLTSCLYPVEQTDPDLWTASSSPTVSEGNEMTMLSSDSKPQTMHDSYLPCNVSCFTQIELESVNCHSYSADNSMPNGTCSDSHC